MTIRKKFLLFFIIIFVGALMIFFYFNMFIKSQGLLNENILCDPKFSKWFQWKIQTNLTDKQKNVVGYLRKSSIIFNKAFVTTTVQSGSNYGYIDPKGAITIIEQAIKELKALACPNECITYRDISIKLMENFIAYHKLRLTFKEGTEEFTSQYEKFQLSEIKSGLDAKQYSEYFRALKKAGLFSNITKESRNVDAKRE